MLASIFEHVRDIEEFLGANPHFQWMGDSESLEWSSSQSIGLESMLTLEGALRRSLRILESLWISKLSSYQFIILLLSFFLFICFSRLGIFSGILEA